MMRCYDSPVSALPALWNPQLGAKPLSIKSTTEHFDGAGLCCELACVCEAFVSLPLAECTHPFLSASGD